MSDLISKQVLDLWNKYKPTIAVDAIEYDRELKKLLGTNLAEVGTDCISRQAAIDALRKLREEDIEDYGCEIPEGFNQDHLDRATFAIKQLPPIQPKRGKWIVNKYGITICSECRKPRRDNRIDHIGWCNGCGAKMEVTT